MSATSNEPVSVLKARGEAAPSKPGHRHKSDVPTVLFSVIGARGLTPPDARLGISPLATVTVGDKQFSTKALEDNAEPRWDETFSVELPPLSALTPAPEALVCVTDAKTKQALGQLSVALEGHKDVPFSLATTHWFGLKPVKTAADDKKKKSATKRKKSDGFTKRRCGEVLLRIGKKTGAALGDTNSELMDALMHAAEPIHFEDYDKVPLADIIAETESVVDESLDSTERSLRLTGQIRQIGAATLEELQAQGDRLRGMQDSVVRINADLKQGERELRNIASVGGMLVNQVTKHPEKDDYKYRYIDKKKNRIDTSEGLTVPSSSATPASPSSSSPPPDAVALVGTRKMIQEGAFSHLDSATVSKIGRTEDNLDRLDAELTEIQAVSKLIGAEVAEHNRMLEELGPAVQRTIERTTKASTKTKHEW